MAEEFKRRAAGWNAVEGGGRTWLHSAFCSQDPDCMLLKRGLVLSSFVGPASAGIIATSAFISSRSQKVEEDYRKYAYNASARRLVRLRRSTEKAVIVVWYGGSGKPKRRKFESNAKTNHPYLHLSCRAGVF